MALSKAEARKKFHFRRNFLEAETPISCELKTTFNALCSSPMKNNEQEEKKGIENTK
ncbi:MAG: hypothetical protein FWG75_05325 [Cystobacterineae bacterium]|nr:hypothetical protein [Cystobacterineae bacterium]